MINNSIQKRDVKGRVATDWNGVGLGTGTQSSWVMNLGGSCSCAELPACSQLCLAEGAGEQRCRSGVCPSEPLLWFDDLLCLSVFGHAIRKAVDSRYNVEPSPSLCWQRCCDIHPLFSFLSSALTHNAMDLSGSGGSGFPSGSIYRQVVGFKMQDNVF